MLLSPERAYTRRLGRAQAPPEVVCPSAKRDSRLDAKTGPVCHKTGH